MRLRQILTNLIGNAVKFTDEGEVVVRVMTLEETDEMAWLRFEVRDTGIGIAPEAHNRIFEDFAQADGSTTRQYGGTGLGLAIAKQLTDMMGGEIGLESTSGEGATFWLTVPLEKQSAQTQDSRPPDHALKGLHALIIDDNATNRELLRDQLTAWQMHPDLAENGPQALGMLHAAIERSTPYDVAILDTWMPGMDGQALARAIKAIPGIADVHLIMLTSMRGEEEVLQDRQIGIAAHLHKPIRQSQLHDCLMTVMRGSNDTQLDQSPTASDRVATPPVIASRILLAEDNQVNQEVALGMLKALSCEVDIATNGQEALDAVARASYDLVLMDCQMPEMGGLEATTIIREREASMGGKPTPIIALTAHATASDREQCLAAGMDDYLSKPFTQEQLFSVIERWLPSQSIHLSVPLGATSDASAGWADHTVDRQTLDGLRSFVDGSQLLRRVVHAYLDEAPQQIAEMRRAIVHGEAEKLWLAAHSFKSGSANAGALGLSQLGRSIEDFGRAHTTDGAQPFLDRIEAAFSAVQTALLAEVESDRSS